MKRVFVVKEEELEQAKKLQKKLLSTPNDAGIAFVGIKVQPACELQPLPIFKISVGCDKHPEAVAAYAKYLLREDVIAEHQLQIEAFAGLTKNNVDT